MRIGICDDELIIRKELLKLCNEYKEYNINDIEIKGFHSGEELLMYAETLDILFLDIQMQGMNGLQTAEKIREKDDSMIIIFLTGFTGFMQQGYKVKAFRYLLKPIKDQEFYDALADAIVDLTRNSKAIVDMNGDTKFVKLGDIIYIEYNNRCTIVRTKRESYESSASMNEWEDVLNNGDFFRVHKAYIVNMTYIQEIGRQVILDNGEKVELAIRQSGRLKRACREFRRQNAR